jgi:hypothetical protein
MAVKRWVVAAVAIATIVLLSVVAVGAGSAPTTRNGSSPSRATVTGVYLLGAWVIAVFVLVRYLVPERRGVKRGRRRSSWVVVVLLLVGLLTAELWIVMDRRQRSQDQTAPQGLVTTMPITPETVATPSTVAPPQTEPDQPPNVLLVALAGIVVVVVGIGLIGRERVGESTDVPSGGSLALVLDDLIADLEHSQDPRKVIIGAYVRMEQALAQDGVPKYGHEAPREFLTRALERLNVGRRAAERLTDLFAEARFSLHEMEPAMATEALAALRDVRSELGVKV